MPANLENSAVAIRLEKVSLHSNLKEGQCQKCSNYHTIALTSHASKVRLQQYVNWELPDIQAEFRIDRGTRDQHLLGHRKKKENSRKTSASLTMLKSLTGWITTNCGKFWNRRKYQTTLPASWGTCMQVKKQQLEPDMEQWTGSKLGNEYIKTVHCHPAYLTLCRVCHVKC